MSPLTRVVNNRTIEALGWALVHFAWQGALLAVLLAGILRLVRRSSPQARYLVATAILGMMAACLPATLVWQIRGSGPAAASSHGEYAHTVQHPEGSDRNIPIAVNPVEVSGTSVAPVAGVASAAATQKAVPVPPQVSTTRFDVDRVHRTIAPWLGWLVAAWALGVALFSSRLGLCWVKIQRVRRASHRPAAANWQVALTRVASRLGLTQPVQLVESALVEVPTVIGWLRPIVLLPVSALTGLAPAQIEALLAHELAHIRRHDYLVNLLQTGVETLLFYHPAVWWVSGYIRQTREHCCDDVAAAVCGSTVDYVRTLALLEERRHAAAVLSVAASGGSLLERIRRLAGPTETAHAHGGMAAVVLLVALFTAFSLFAVNARSASEQKTRNRPAANEQIEDTQQDSVKVRLLDMQRNPPPAEKTRTSAAPRASSVQLAIADASDDKQADEVTGTLVSANDQPIVEFKVETFRQTGHPESTFVTNDNGEFRVPAAWFRDPLFAGELFVCIARDSAGGLGWFQIQSSSARAGNIGNADVPRPMPFRFALLPAKRTITGRILDPEQQPLKGVRIQVERLAHPLNGDLFLYGFGMADELPLPSVMTDESGRFQLKLPTEATVTLHALHPAWVVRHLAAAERDDLGDVVMLAAGRIAGKVTFAETGQPAPDIVISASRHNAARGRSMQRNKRGDESDANLGLDGFCVTDAEGKYEIGGLKADSHDMYVNAGPDHRDLLGPNLQGIEVRTGETKAIEFTVQKGRRVAGRVVEADSGKPIPGRRVYVSVFRDKEHRSLISSKYPHVDDGGEFEAYVLPGFASLRVEASREESLKQIPESTREFEIGDRGLVPPVVLKLRAPTPAEERRLLPKMTLQFNTRRNSIGGFSFDREGATVVTAGWLNVDDDPEAWQKGTSRGDLRIWDARSSAEIARCEGEFGGLFDVAISPDGTALATAGRLLNSADASELRIWDLKTRKPRAVLEGHTHWVLAVTYSPGGEFLVSGSFDKTARVWDVATGKELTALIQSSTPSFLRFSRDGQTLVVGCRGGSIKLYETGTWKERKALEVRDWRFFDVDLSPDSNLLAAGGVPYEPDGKTIKGDTSGIMRIWDAATGQEIRTWRVPGHPSSLAFSPNGKHLASAAHTSSVWDVKTGEELAVIYRSVSSSGDQIRYSPDGKTLAIGGHPGLQFWDVSPLLSAGEGSK